VPASRGREFVDKTSPMSHDEVLNLLNRTLDNSRTSVELAKAVLRDAATELRSIQSHEAYSCAVLIRLIKRLGGRPVRGARAANDEAGLTGLEPGLARLISVQNRMQQELRHNLARIAEDRIRLRLEKILDAIDQHVRRLYGTPRHSGSRAEAPDQRLTDRGLSSPEEAEGGGGSPTETP
jgi:non-ribosomal peptide synthetase component F